VNGVVAGTPWRNLTEAAGEEAAEATSKTGTVDEESYPQKKLVTAVEARQIVCQTRHQTAFSDAQDKAAC